MWVFFLTILKNKRANGFVNSGSSAGEGEEGQT